MLLATTMTTKMRPPLFCDLAPHIILDGLCYHISYSKIHPQLPILVLLGRTNIVYHKKPIATGVYGATETTGPQDEQPAQQDHNPQKEIAVHHEREIHDESNDITIKHLSTNYESVKFTEVIQCSVSNGSSTLAFDPIHPFFAMTHQKGCMISIYEISFDEKKKSRLVETFGQHNRKITCVSFGEISQHIRHVASGDSSGNIKVHRIDLQSENSAICIGLINNTSIDGYDFNSSNSIVNIGWLGQTMMSTNSDGKIWKVVNTRDDKKWEITTPNIQKSPETLDAIHQTFMRLNVSNVIVHPSTCFSAVSCKSDKISVVTIHDIRGDCSAVKSMYESPLYVNSMCFSRDGSRLYLGCTKDIIVLGVSPNGDNMSVLLKHCFGHTRHISSVIIHVTSEGKSILLAGDLTGHVVLLKNL
jgi:hypothetical protein